MTVSSFFSASLHPPLIGVCIDQTAQTLTSIVESGSFCVNVLSSAQADLSTRFATPGNEAIRFDELVFDHGGPSGAPRPNGCLAHIECSLENRVVAGDHVVCFGLVLDVEVANLQPLVFQRGQYRSLLT